MEENPEDVDSCQHRSVVESSELGQTVCTDCGMVLESNMFVQHTPYDPTTVYQSRDSGEIGSLGARNWIGKTRRSHRENTLESLKRHHKQTCHILNIPNPSIEIVWNQFLSLLQVHQFQVGSRGNTVLATCLFLWIKSNKYAIRLDQILNILHVSHSHFRRALFEFHTNQSTLVHPSNPSIHFPKYSQKLTQNLSDQRALVKLADSTLQLVKRSLLDQGRKESPLSMACMWIAYEAFSGKKLHERKMTDLLFSTDEGVSVHTIKERYLEIIPLCLESGKKLPFLPDLKESNLRLHLKTILSFVNAPVQTASVAPHPPSFVASEQRRQYLVERIRGAKARLESIQRYGIELLSLKKTDSRASLEEQKKEDTLEPSQPASWLEASIDLTDDLIEELILSGYSEQDILNLKFKKGPGFVSAGGITKTVDDEESDSEDI